MTWMLDIEVTLDLQGYIELHDDDHDDHDGDGHDNDHDVDEDAKD